VLTVPHHPRLDPPSCPPIGLPQRPILLQIIPTHPCQSHTPPPANRVHLQRLNLLPHKLRPLNPLADRLLVRQVPLRVERLVQSRPEVGEAEGVLLA
jgi:hypothetical protein